MSSEAEKVCGEFLQFLMRLKHWGESHYQKEFNINGKNGYALTDRQFQILATLYHIKQCTLTDLEERLHISGGSLSIGITKLVQEGYIQRAYPKEGEDRRKTYLHLTEQGNEALWEAYDRVMKVFVEFYENLDEGQQKNFQEGMEKLNKVFAK